MLSKTYLIVSLLFLTILLVCCVNISVVGKNTSWLCQFQNFSPLKISKTKFTIVVIDYSRDGSDDGALSLKDVETIRKSGKIVLAYMNVGYAEDWRFYWNKIKNATFVGNEGKWSGEYKILNFTDDEWEKVLHEYVEKIISEGFDGIYLDGVDAYENFKDKKIHEEEMVTLVKKIRSWIGQDKKLSILNAYNLIDYDSSISHLIDYLSVEGLFYKKTRKVKPSRYLPILKKIKEFMKDGVEILSLDYVDDGSGYEGENLKRILDYVKLARKNGFIPYAARKDLKLNVLNVIPGIQGE